MKKDTANSSKHKPSGCQCNCSCHTEASEPNETKDVAHDCERVPTTPKKNASEVDYAFLTPPRSDGSQSHNEASSSKRRRLISFDSNTGEELDRNGTATKLNYESTLPSDVSEVSADDCVDDYLYENIRRTTVQRLWQVNYGEDGDRVIRTTGICKLYEFVTWYDVVKNKRLSKEPWTLSAEEKEKVVGKWKCRGSGRVKFIQNLVEGYNCGMIRMEMIHEGTLNTLMCHQLIEEPIMPMDSKKGKSYTWHCVDWAYNTAYDGIRRTFAIRFDDGMEAVRWKSLVEESKVNNRRVRSGLDVPDNEAVDELSDVLQKMSTM